MQDNAEQIRLLATEGERLAGEVKKRAEGLKATTTEATEIGSLANQTSETVGNINSIVTDVNHAVSTLAESLRDTVEFLEKVVLKDYRQFADIGENYYHDSEGFSDSMSTVEESVKELADTITDIAGALEGIHATINESTVGVSDIADKTTHVVEQTIQNNVLVDNCIETVEKLNEITRTFQIH